MPNDDSSKTITSPSDLAKLASEISTKLVEIPIKAIELQLLLPLSTQSMLTDCLDHEESFRRNSYGPKTVGKNTVQVLSLTPLFKAWRAVWSKFSLDAVHKFVFNINLPASNIGETCTDSRIHWGRLVPETGGLAITEGRVAQSILELAMVMRVRSKGTASFTLIGAEESRAMQSRSIPENKDIFKSLENTLQQLSTPKKAE